MRLPRTSTLLAVVLVALTVATGTPSATTAAACGDVATATCGVQGIEDAGYFHGLIAVSGATWVFRDAVSAGTEPGCGDCTWSVVIACPTATPGSPSSPPDCINAATSPTCAPDQLLYRLYLTTAAVADQLEGTLCLGGGVDPIPIGDIATVDVERYLRNARPPDLAVTTQPATATLTSLPTSFDAAAPAGLQPVRFGDGDLTETITLLLDATSWDWGDGSGTGWLDPPADVQHSFLSSGVAQGALTARWAATYTISYQGVTAGPYQAAGEVTKTQPFTLPVRTSSPDLVSR